MAISIAKMSAILGLNSKGFTTGFMKASRTVKRFTTGMAATATKLTAFGGMIAGVAGVAGIGALTASAFKNIDAMSKMADELDANVENLSAFELAAELAGTSVGSLHKGMRFMARSIGEVSLGLSKEGKKALDAIGLSLEDVEGKTTDEQFLVIADAMKGVESASVRAAAAQKLFGRSGVEMLNMLMQGREGLMAVREEGEAMGVVFDRKLGAKVEMANDAMTRLQFLFKGASNQIAGELAPFVQELADRFVAFSKESGGMGKIVVGAFEKIAKGIAFVSDLATGIVGAFNIVRSGILFAIGGVVKGLYKLGEGIVWVINLIPTVDVKMSDFLDGYADELFASAEEIGIKGLDQLDAAFAGKTGKKVAKFFEDVKAKSDEAAEEIVEKSRASLARTVGSTLAPDEKTKRATMALQAKASRIVFGGPEGVEKRTKIEGDPTQTDLLRQLVSGVQNIKTVSST